MQKIGYPTKSPDVHDSVDLQKYYESVNITSTGFFDNALSIAQFDASREWSALGKPTNKDEWGMSVPTVNVRTVFASINCFSAECLRPIITPLATKLSSPPESCRNRCFMIQAYPST